MERSITFNSNINTSNNKYIGVWVTKNGYVRHEFLPNGRYTESRGDKRSAYNGYYNILGNHVEYLDDSGFTADGDFVDGIFYHAGMVLYKEEKLNVDNTTETYHKKLAY